MKREELINHLRQNTELIKEALFWDIFYTEEQDFLESEYINMLFRIAEKKIGTKVKKILDVPCGWGRLHKYFYEQNREVWGVDINKNFIDLAKELNPYFKDNYLIEDMRKIKFNNEFDAIINWFQSFGYFSDEENRAFLKKLYNALKPGGILILDVMTPYLDYRYFYPHIKKPPIIFLYEVKDIVRLDILDKKSNDLIVFDSFLYKKTSPKLMKLVDKTSIKIRLYPILELKKMLEDTGFKILYAFDDASINLVDLTKEDTTVHYMIWLVYKPK